MRYIVRHQQVGVWSRDEVVDEKALPADAWQRLLSLGAVAVAPEEQGADQTDQTSDQSDQKAPPVVVEPKVEPQPERHPVAERPRARAKDGA
jgi:hypothetical protein